MEMDEEKNMASLWSVFSSACAAVERAMIAECSGSPHDRPERGDVIHLLRILRDSRRDFMAAAGAFDDAWISSDEEAALRDAASLAVIVADKFSVTDEEIEAAKPQFMTSTGRVTDVPWFPPRFDA